ncbi:hypothetical protein CRUP_006737 [Coryphaenoides rupestris]|nr:hypothetical protein CRUP_006737 [Coryphaenoides rupestris]
MSGHRESPDSSKRATLQSRGTTERVYLQKSNVCSRSYFMFVLVFIHMYVIIHGVAQLYANYNNGEEGEEGVDTTSDQETPSSDQQPLGPQHPQSKPEVERHMFLPRRDGVKVGHVQKLSLVADEVHDMRTLSLKPLLFEIPRFLSDDECGVVMQLAQLKGLVESQLMVQEGQEQLVEELDLSPEEIFHLLDINQDGQLQLKEILTHSRVREGIWLTPESLREIYAGLHADKDHNGLLSLEEFRQLSSDAFQRFLLQHGVKSSQLVRNSRHTWLDQGPGAHQLPDTLVDLSEPLQVVRYQKGGHYHAHHDSGPVYPETACTHTRRAALDSMPFETSCRRNCDRSNLRVKPTRGTAVFWYNYLSDGKGWVGEQDQYSLHGGCVVTQGTKWVANKWINIDPDYQRQVRYQQLVSQTPEDEEDEDGLVFSHSVHDTHQDL